MKSLDINKINKKAQQLAEKAALDKARQEEHRRIDEKKKKEEQERLTKQGRKVREACEQFHKWAMRNHIAPEWRLKPKHWWSEKLSGWELVSGYKIGEIPFYDSTADVLIYLVVLKDHHLTILTRTYSPYSDPFHYERNQDDHELGEFPLDKIEETITGIVQRSGVPFS